MVVTAQQNRPGIAIDPILGTPAVDDAGTQTILIVDDELGPRESLKLILNQDYRVVAAKDGYEALNLFERQRPAMVISDIRMPGMDGIELMKNVRRLSPEVPYVLLTGYGTLQTAQEAIRMGAFDYISKPYNIEDIQRVVESALAETDRKRTASRSINELQAFNSEMAKHVQELEKKASLGDLSAELIHDLNNPMCVLTGYIDLLEGTLRQEMGDPDDDRPFLANVKRQIEHCVKLSRRLLDYANNTRQEWEGACVNELIQDTLFILRTRMRHCNVRVEEHLGDVPATWVLPSPLHQVFYNIIANALDAMESTDGGELTVMTALIPADQTGNGREAIEILIRDTGPGMPKEVAENVFSAFYTTKPKGKGTGLGLAICKRVVNEHSGTISLDSEEGQGATFRIVIPVFVEQPDPVDLAGAMSGVGL